MFTAGGTSDEAQTSMKLSKMALVS